MDIKEAEKILRRTNCPKCRLSADTLMHRFCDYKECPVRDALATKYSSRPRNKLHGSE